MFSVERAADELGFRSRVPLESGLRAALAALDQ
jgi:nucleoside-diphosphate-sugar epimerase